MSMARRVLHNGSRVFTVKDFAAIKRDTAALAGMSIDTLFEALAIDDRNIKLVDKGMLLAYAQLMRDMVFDAHHIFVDYRNVPEATGPTRRGPFKNVLVGADVYNPTGDKSHPITFLVTEHDSEDHAVILPFMYDTSSNFWYPSLVGATYRLDDKVMKVSIGTFPGYEPIDAELHKQQYSEVVGTLYEMVRDVYHLTSMSNVTLKSNEPGRVKQMMARKKGVELEAYHTIKLPSRPHTKRAPGGGTHASPAMHYRRAHYRTLAAGTSKQRETYVHETIVGAVADGKITADYEV